MSYCAKCGNKIEDGQNYCGKCGTMLGTSGVPHNNSASQGNDAFENAAQTVTNAFNNFNTTEDNTNEYDMQDIESNKGFALLSYLWLLVIIPIFMRKDSKFTRFHANQGLVLLIVDVIFETAKNIILGVLKIVFPAHHSMAGMWTRGIIYNSAHALLSLISLLLLILMILGIVNVIQGRAKQLPIIGGVKILK